MPTKIEVYFVDGVTVSFDVHSDVDLHKITGQYLAFDDLFINLANVLFIKKKEA